MPTKELSRALEQHARSRAGELAAALQRAMRVPATAERLREAGIDPALLQDADDALAALGSLPVLRKDDLITRQRGEPPFGGMVPAGVTPRRIFQSPGPLYEAQLTEGDEWDWAPALAAAGIGAGEVAVNCFGYHLSPAGAMFDHGLAAVGAAVVPAGVGSQDLQLQAVLDTGASVYIGLPSYLKTLLDRFAASSGAAAWPVSKAILTAEPLPPSLRAELERHVPVVRMAYGTAEAGCIAYEDGAGPGMRVNDAVFVQVCDPGTGEAIAEGEGEVVITRLRGEYPLVRFGTGDLSAWQVDSDGGLRLAGVLGRVGEAVKVRGMFLHPRQAAAALGDVPGVSGFRFVVRRQDHVDAIRCEVVGDGHDTGDGGAELAGRVTAAIRERLRFRAEVVVVDRIPEDSPVLVDERDWS